MAKVLIHEHFSMFGLPNQIISDNGAEFVNKLWTELFSELKILHTSTQGPGEQKRDSWSDRTTGD